MTRFSAIVGTVLGIALVCVYPFALGQRAGDPPATAPGDPSADAAALTGRGGRGGGGGGGGGRRGANPYGFSGPLPGAAVYAEHCASCHGTDLSGGRAHSLFQVDFLAENKDADLIEVIRDGMPGAEMAAFKDKLSEDQINELVKYIRSQSGVMLPRPALNNPDGAILKTQKQTVKVEVVVKGLVAPWGMSFLPDGRMLVTERNVNNGALRIIDKGVASEPIIGTPVSYAGQDSGMFDVTIHPKYAENGWIYLSYSSAQATPATAPAAIAPAPVAVADAAAPAAQDAAAPRGGGRRGRGGASPPTMTNFVRGRIKDGKWVDQQFIFQAPDSMYTVSGAHYGTRFIWDKEGHLFYSIGDRGVIANAQDLSNPLGKVHRVNDDGTIPKDNPFVNTPNAVASIWTYGNRNPQGFSWDPVTGKLWESEHGPTAGDEINVLKPGHNYGWGVATKGSQDGITKTSAPGMDDPIVYYIPTMAPSGITFYTGDKFPAWKNSLFVGGLAGQQLRRLEVADETVTSQEVIFNQYGRVRDVVQGPDGYLYLLIQNATSDTAGFGGSAQTPGLVARLVPAQ